MAEPLAALKAGDTFDFFGNSQPKCPHCGAEHDIDDNEWYFLYDEDGPHEVECPACDLVFFVQTRAIYTFSTNDQD